jgi:hypothetical protein
MPLANLSAPGLVSGTTWHVLPDTKLRAELLAKVRALRQFADIM